MLDHFFFEGKVFPGPVFQEKILCKDMVRQSGFYSANWTSLQDIRGVQINQRICRNSYSMEMVFTYLEGWGKLKMEKMNNTYRVYLPSAKWGVTVLSHSDVCFKFARIFVDLATGKLCTQYIRHLVDSAPSYIGTFFSWILNDNMSNVIEFKICIFITIIISSMLDKLAY